MVVFETAALLCVGTPLVTFASLAFALGGFTISSHWRMVFLQTLAVAGVAFLLMSVLGLRKISTTLSVTQR